MKLRNVFPKRLAGAYTVLAIIKKYIYIYIGITSCKEIRKGQTFNCSALQDFHSCQNVKEKVPLRVKAGKVL